MLFRSATNHAAFAEAEQQVKDRIQKVLNQKGKKTVAEFYRQLGQVMWNNCGMARNEKRLTEALKKIPEIRDEFEKNLLVPGTGTDFNQSLQNALRLADLMEFAELLARDALYRKESCGAHFREESQTPGGEAQRDDKNFCNVAAWEFKGLTKEPTLHVEPLEFKDIELSQRSYK